MLHTTMKTAPILHDASASFRHHLICPSLRPMPPPRSLLRYCHMLYADAGIYACHAIFVYRLFAISPIARCFLRRARRWRDATPTADMARRRVIRLLLTPLPDITAIQEQE